MGLFKKAARRAALAAARYSQRLKEDLIEFESLILDEIYTFVGSKNQRCYVFTAIGVTEFGKRYFFARVLDQPSSACLRRFLALLPPARHYFSDGAPMYGEVLGTAVLQEKNAATALVESLNSRFRQYVPWLRRKTKGYSKSLPGMIDSLNLILQEKICPAMQK